MSSSPYTDERVADPDDLSRRERARVGATRRGVVTLADVALEVGVSARTVSRVVNGQGGCSPETKQRIEAAIETLGYRPNMMARGLLTNRSDTIGLVGLEMSDPFFTELAEGVQQAARSSHRTMFFASTDGDPSRQAEVLASLHGHGVDGVIMFPANDTMADIARTAALGLPIVLVNHDPRVGAPLITEGRRLDNVATVQCDLRGGARLAVEHLIARGRRRIALATESRSRVHQTAPRRESGYREALGAADIAFDPTLVATSTNTVDGGRECARALLALAHRPDAVFAYNDLMAIGILQEFHRAGVRVPDDIAVVGFDDIAMCDAVIPKLTTVRIDRDRLGEMAVEALWRLLDDPTDTEPAAPLAVDLVVRAST